MSKVKWISTKKEEPKIGDYYYCKVDTKQDSILKTIVEWAKYPNGNYDWDLSGVQHFGGFKEDAEVIEWLDEPFYKSKDCPTNECVFPEKCRKFDRCISIGT